MVVDCSTGRSVKRSTGQMEANPVARQRLGRFSVTVSTQDLLDRSSQEGSSDFYCSCNFRCCCGCDGNFLWRGDLAQTLITKLRFQQAGTELGRLMPFTRKFLQNPYGKGRGCALSCYRSSDKTSSTNFTKSKSKNLIEYH